MSRATPDDGIIINYVANGPGIWYDPRFDCTDLWQGHFSSAQIFERFVGPGGEFSKFDPTVEFSNVFCPVLIASGVFDFAAVATAWHKFKDLLAKHTGHSRRAAIIRILRSRRYSTRHCSNG